MNNLDPSYLLYRTLNNVDSSDESVLKLVDQLLDNKDMKINTYFPFTIEKSNTRDIQLWRASLHQCIEGSMDDVIRYDIFEKILEAFPMIDLSATLDIRTPIAIAYQISALSLIITTTSITDDKIREKMIKSLTESSILQDDIKINEKGLDPNFTDILRTLKSQKDRPEVVLAPLSLVITTTSITDDISRLNIVKYFTDEDFKEGYPEIDFNVEGFKKFEETPIVLAMTTKSIKSRPIRNKIIESLVDDGKVTINKKHVTKAFETTLDATSRFIILNAYLKNPDANKNSDEDSSGSKRRAVIDISKSIITDNIETMTCDVCSKKPEYLCQGCSVMKYCSKKCQQKSWENGHYEDCR